MNKHMHLIQTAAFILFRFCRDTG